MPDLPTLTVSQAQMDVILEAFKDFYQTTTPEATATAYRRHLAKMVIGVVTNYQAGIIDKERDARINSKVAEVNAFFPNPDTIP
jgi:hypothetical protein